MLAKKLLPTVDLIRNRFQYEQLLTSPYEIGLYKKQINLLVYTVWIFYRKSKPNILWWNNNLYLDYCGTKIKLQLLSGGK